MPTFVPDFVDDLERELEDARERLAWLLERTEALAELHAYAYDLAARLKKPLSADDVFGSAQTEKERAQLRLLADRITAPEPGGHLVSDEGEGAGTQLETGAGL